jgi:hypothetical protein
LRFPAAGPASAPSAFLGFPSVFLGLSAAFVGRLRLVLLEGGCDLCGVRNPNVSNDKRSEVVVEVVVMMVVTTTTTMTMMMRPTAHP